MVRASYVALFLLLALMIASPLTRVNAAPINLLQNPGFESIGLDPWVANGHGTYEVHKVSDGTAHGDSWYAFLGVWYESYAWLTQGVGSKCAQSLDVWYRGSRSSGSVDFIIGVAYSDGSADSWYLTDAQPTAWTHLIKNVHTDRWVIDVEASVYSWTSVDSGWLDVDDFNLEACAAPTQYQLTISVSPSGAGTTNPAAASYMYDSGTTVTVAATPASGYMFDSWLLDGTPDGSANPITVTMDAPHALVAQFLSPKAIKANVLADLQALRATVTNKADAKVLDDAILHLTRSLDSSLWKDETHLNPKTGVKVFLEEEAGVASLLMLKLLPKSTVDKVVLQGFIDRLVAADKLLASAAISDASSGSPILLKLANKAVAQGDTLAKAGKYVLAMQQYCNAWLITPKK